MVIFSPVLAKPSKYLQPKSFAKSSESLDDTSLSFVKSYLFPNKILPIFDLLFWFISSIHDKIKSNVSFFVISKKIL